MSNRPVTIEDDIGSSGESVEVLRERLSTMKRLMAERHAAAAAAGRSGGRLGGGYQQHQNTAGEDMSWMRQPPQRNPGIIDGNFLSVALCGALVTIISVAVYAFWSLYLAVLKKFPSKHTEL